MSDRSVASATPVVVDSHAHVWTIDSDYPWQPLLGYVPDRSFTANRLIAEMDGAGVDHAVLVQPSVYGWDHRYLLSAVERHRDRFSAVGLLNHESESWPTELERLLSVGIKGLRFNLIASPSADWLLDRKFRSLWVRMADQSIVACFQAYPQQLPQVAELSTAIRDLTLVVDHLGKPDMRRSDLHHNLLHLADQPNVYVKLAAFYLHSLAPAPWRDMWDLVRATLAAFGPKRLMWGSDAPGSLKGDSYPATLAPICELAESATTLRQLIGITAASVFRLSARPINLTPGPCLGALEVSPHV